VDLGGIDPENHSLVNMMEALAGYESDAEGIWHGRLAAFGHQMVWSTPESLRERLPLTIAGLTITADARLDNREELFRALDISPAERSDCSDSGLILSAWLKWRERCPEHLLGAFAFAIWDSREQKLFCSRDHLGERQLFYRHQGRKLVFSNEVPGILAAPGSIMRLNRPKLAQLASAGRGFNREGETLFENIFYVPAASTLTFDIRGLSFRRWWSPDPDLRLPYKSDEQILEVFRELMFDAVRARLRSAFPVTAELSGGLDSSGIVSIASRILADRGKQLTTLSAVLPEGHDAGLSDERPFIDQFRGWSNITFRYVTAPDRGPFDHLETPTAHWDSPTLPGTHYLNLAFAEEAHHLGAREILGGCFGEMGPSCHGHGHYFELFKALRWTTLLRKMQDQARVEHKGVCRLLRGKLVKHLRMTLPISYWRSDVFHSHFIHRHLPLDHAATYSGRPWPGHDHRSEQANRIQHARNKFSNGRLTMRRHGPQVAFTQPFLDKRLLEFCLAAPGDLKIRNGYTRYLIRAGLDQILPKQIQWRTSKHPFSPDYLIRYNAQREKVRKHLCNIAPADPVREIVNIKRSLQLLQGHDFRAFSSATQAVYAIHFLRQFPEFAANR
jgi:asparagine synthase (glutamine-hydrolysing)